MSDIQGIDAIASGTGRPHSPAAAWQQFQALFMKDLVREMRQSAGGEEGMFGSGPESGVMEDWYDQFLSEHLASATRFKLAPATAQQTHTTPEVKP